MIRLFGGYVFRVDGSVEYSCLLGGCVHMLTRCAREVGVSVEYVCLLGWVLHG
jgi:hypothetical protein